MKCAKCGNEFNDGAKFCPKCGEEVEMERPAEAKPKFCAKCGKELKPGYSFCSNCGAAIESVTADVTEKPKKSMKSDKKIILSVFGVIAVIVVGVCMYLNSDSSRYQAFVRFQEEYLDDHSDFPEYNDCSARIIMSPKNEKWLAIYDVISVDADEDGNIDVEDVKKDKVVLYRYSWGKVRKVTAFTKEPVGMLGSFSVIDGSLYFSTMRSVDGIQNMQGDTSSPARKLDYSYVLDDHNKFQKVGLKSVKKKDEGGYEYLQYSIKDSDILLWKFQYLSGLVPFYDRQSFQLTMTNNITSGEASDFAGFVEVLRKHKIKDQTDLQIAYGKAYQELGLWHTFFDMDDMMDYDSDYPVVGAICKDSATYWVRTSGNLALTALEDGTQFEQALKSVDRRKVTRIEQYAAAYVELKGSIQIPSEVTYIGQSAFCGNEELESVNLPDHLETIGSDAFEGCKNLQQIEVPESVEYIGEDAFRISDYRTLVIIAKDGSYAQEYAENNGLDCQAKKLSDKELQERADIENALTEYQEYIESEEYYENAYDYTYVSLFYLNDDKIPECVAWNSEYGDDFYHGKADVLSFVNGELVREEIFMAQMGYEGFRYDPGSSKFYASRWVNGAGAEYTVYELTDSFETVSTILDYQVARPGEEKYTVDGRDLGSTQAVEQYIADLGFDYGFGRDDLYDSVSEAYEYLEKE